MDNTENVTVPYRPVPLHVDSMWRRLFLSAFLIFLWAGTRAGAVQVFSPFYTAHEHDPGGIRLPNPETPNSIFPDSLQWSPGGDTRFGLQLLIACDRADRTYRAQDLIGIRCGLLNRGSSDVYLARSQYSPNKVSGAGGGYTLKIDAPADVERRSYGWLGDDCCRSPTRIPIQVRIPPGSVFNPSPDRKFYNTSNGILRLPTPGTYRLWHTLDFDSLCSSIPVGFSIIRSDTLVITVKPQLLVPRLIRGLDSAWRDLKSGWRRFWLGMNRQD